MPIPRPRIPYFLIFYSTTFTFFALLLTALLLITPGDHIYQSFKAGELYRIIIVGCVYLLTFVIAVFIYAYRLFSTRSALANIPREWDLSGNEKDNPSLGLGMGRRMGRVVREGWLRSAVIAYQSTPRNTEGDSQLWHTLSKKGKGRLRGNKGERPSVDSIGEPVWGTIEHPGRSGPACPDLPDLHFDSVISELPNLLEAKAVSLAPVSELGRPNENEKLVPEPVVVDLLRRPLHMGMRAYIDNLLSLNVIHSEDGIITDFLMLYERARFSGEPLTEEQFRHLMDLSSAIMRNMKALDEGGRNELLSRTEHVKDPSDDYMDGDQDTASDGTTRHRKQLRAEASYSSLTSQSDAQVTAYTAPSRARFSRNLSDHSGASISLSGSVIHHVPDCTTPPDGGQASSDSFATSPSISASSTGSVIRGAASRTP